MKSTLFSLLLLVVHCFGVSSPLYCQEPRLVTLRDQFARRYLQPDAHFALAKYYLDVGNNVQAFYILEYARRYRFEEKDFDTAFIKFFGDPMPEPPDDAKAAFETASKLVAQQKYDQADVNFQKASNIYGKSFFINAWIGRFYYKVRTDSARALPYYFKAYFLYPHAYETEFVESRIRAISISDAETSFKARIAEGKTLIELTRDQNPLIVNMALAEMAKNWKQDYLDILPDIMSNDGSLVRWGAFVIFQKHAGSSVSHMIDRMYAEKDLRKRGLAAYAIVQRTGPEKFQLLEQMLSDEAELVRFDAVSALLEKGGPTGAQILRKHLRIEKQPRLKALMDAALQRPSS